MRILTDIWTTFTWTLFDFASTPRLVIPISLVIVVLSLVLKKPKWLKFLGKVTAVLTVVYLALATPLVASTLIQGLTNFLPPNTNSVPENVDVIVVLRREEELGYSCYDLGVQLWQENRAPKLFVTGLEQTTYMINWFQAEGWPLTILEGTLCARTTYEEALSAVAILPPETARNIILITDPPHLLRSLLTFQAFGFEVSPIMHPLPSELPAL